MSELKDWTVEELVLELRHRERQRTRNADRGSGSSRGRAAELAEVPTARLAGVLRDRQRVIYGIDDRQDIYQVQRPGEGPRRLAWPPSCKAVDLRRKRATAPTLRTTSYRQEFDLCWRRAASRRSASAASAAGFLVARNVIATAGHCVEEPADLATMRFVFGFRMIDAANAPGRRSPPATSTPASAIVGRELTGQGRRLGARAARPAGGRPPAAGRAHARQDRQPASGVRDRAPQRPARQVSRRRRPGARQHAGLVLRRQPRHLRRQLGLAGVQQRSTYQVEGILVRGENDFVSDGGCQVSLVCPDPGCRGEDVTRASVWAAKVPKARSASPAEKRAKDKRARPAGRARRTR